MAIPALALITTLLTEFIEKFLFCTGVVEALSEMGTNFATIFLRELADEGLIILLMFVVVKVLPLPIKDAFRGLGRKQAPLSDESLADFDAEFAVYRCVDCLYQLQDFRASLRRRPD